MSSPKVLSNIVQGIEGLKAAGVGIPVPADPITAALYFLSTEKGQMLVDDVRGVIVDLVHLVHNRHKDEIDKMKAEKPSTSQGA